MGKIDTNIDFKYKTVGDKTTCNVEIEIYDYKYNKARMLLNNFLEGFELHLEYSDFKVESHSKDVAYIRFKHDVPKKCKTKLKQEVTDSYIRAAKLSLIRHEKLHDKPRMSKSRIKSIYPLNDKQLESLDKINSYNSKYKREITEYFVDEVGELVHKLGLEDKQRAKKEKNFNKLIKRIVESEIEGEIIGIYKYKDSDGFPYFQPDIDIDVETPKRIDYTLDSVSIYGEEYKADDVKFVYNNADIYHFVPNSDEHYIIYFDVLR